MNKINCYFLKDNKQNLIYPVDLCVCNKKHKFSFKTKEFDRCDTFDKPISIYRFCDNKPLELVIIGANKENNKIDWKDPDLVREYKRNYRKQKYNIDKELKEINTKKKLILVNEDGKKKLILKTPVVRKQGG